MVATMTQTIGSGFAFPPTLAAIAGLAIYILPVLGSMLLSYGIYQVIIESKTSSRKKMQDRLQGKRTTKKEVDPLLRRGALGQSKSFADGIIGKFKVVPKLQTMLDQADINWSASQVILNLCGGAVLITVALIVFHFHPVLALGCGVSALVLPVMWINYRRGKRVRKIGNQLPDVFDMMSQALRAGHALGGAVQIIYEQMPPPIATEFAQVYHEQNLGIRIEDALQSMADRVDSLDVRFFVTAVKIQRQTGGDLAEVLDSISNVIRERIELAGLVRGLTAEGRLSGWVLLALPVLVFVATMNLNPDYAAVLFDEPIGRIMLMVAGGMQLMGMAMIRWIVNIKV